MLNGHNILTFAHILWQTFLTLFAQLGTCTVPASASAVAPATICNSRTVFTHGSGWTSLFCQYTADGKQK